MEDELRTELLEQVWARRAAQLARPLAPADGGEHLDLVLFRLGRDLFGVEARYVMEVRRVPRVTRVPRVPEWLSGVISHRGRILAVIDLRTFFRLPAHTEDEAGDDQGRLLVVGISEPETALLVDQVLFVDRVLTARVQPRSGGIHDVCPGCVTGIVEQGASGEFVVVLNLAALLGSERLTVQQGIDE